MRIPRRAREAVARHRLVAATAISIGWRAATATIRHFDRIRGLEVIKVRPGFTPTFTFPP